MLSIATVIWSIFYVFANAATAVVHLWWNDLASTAVWLVRKCLANPGVPVLQGIAQLHLLVLLSFAIALSFRITSAHQLQVVVKATQFTLTFDDIETSGGWAEVPLNYSFLEFEDFLVFKPSDPGLQDLISKNDLNCAASTPNALYGSRPLPLAGRPTIRLKRTKRTVNEVRRSFRLDSLNIKPLDAPLGSTTINIRGLRRDKETLLWNVDFPAGFHDMLHVDMASFSRQTWDELEQVEIWADFHHHATKMDWEFCVDDLEVSFEN